jgi:predicted O-methyltransferase YrrM
MLYRLFKPKVEYYPPGHFYSPLPDLKYISEQCARVFSAVEECPGVELRLSAQLSLLDQFGEIVPEFAWPSAPNIVRRYYSGNSFFGKADGFILFGMLRHYKPKRIIEVGSGFSSALMLDVNDTVLEGKAHLTFIEPFPTRLRRLLQETDIGKTNLIETPVQGVALKEFEKLTRGDILFIDSSHVSKVGSDLNFLLFEVLPRLKAGVVVHFHDIFWPFEYPEDWIMRGRAWNEAYMLRTFLLYNNTFKILFFSDYLHQIHPERFRKCIPVAAEERPGSIWLVKEP